MEAVGRRRLHAAEGSGPRTGQWMSARTAPVVARPSVDSHASAVAELLHLQRTIGNEATGRLIAQLIGTPRDRRVPAGGGMPVAETAGVQRRYPRSQYIAMWEREQG